jgi:hypothetical protein
MDRTIREAFLAIVFLSLLFPSHAYAYLDPGTGSLLIQSIIAGLAAVGYALRTNWGKLTRLFRGSRSSRDSKTPS